MTEVLIFIAGFFVGAIYEVRKTTNRLKEIEEEDKKNNDKT